MAPPDIPPFSVGDSLFIVQASSVRVLGQDGTEAEVPLADFEAFLEFLNERLTGEAAGGPARGRHSGGSE